MLDDTTRDAILTVRDEAAGRGIVATLALHRERSHLMRLGNNSVSLNTSEDLTRLDVMVTHGRIQASHTALGHIAGPQEVRAALEVAEAKSRVAMPKDYDPIPDVVETAVAQDSQRDAAVADLDPAVKASGYRQLISSVGTGYNYSGAWTSGLTERYVVTTANRNEAWRTGTDQHFTCVLKHPEQRWELRAVDTGWQGDAVRIGDAARQLQALLPVFEGEPGRRLEPGRYTVLFGAEALADIVAMALWTGLFGRSWEEKQGWTAGRQIGDPVLGPNITITDDPTSELTFRHAFDDSGLTRQPFPLVAAGALAGLMYDPATAARYGHRPTGHNLEGTSITMGTGDGPVDPLAAAADLPSVLYIPALHYMHIPNRSQGLFTGSSRFGAVLVEHGRMVRPIHSSRVTDTFANVLGHVQTLAGHAVSVNQSQSYGRRAPVASCVPAYALIEGVMITDSADTF